MLAWTESERRGAVVLVALLAIGAGYDLWRAHAMRRGRPGEPAPALLAPASPNAAALDTGRIPPPDTAAPGLASPIARVVDLNRAGAADLDQLPGVGPVLARRILEHRARHGPFLRVDELRAVRGIGPRTLERLRPLVTVSASGEMPHAPP